MAKVLLVGEGNVGKSSLVAALKGERFVDGRPTTHGIQISALSFRHPQLDVKEPDHAFGDMRRVQPPAGDLLWVCADHYREYDPGLPILPQRD